MEEKTDKWIDLIAKYLSGNTTPREKALLDDWIREDSSHQALFQEMKNVWTSSDPAESIEVPSIDDSWKEIQPVLFGSEAVIIKSKPRRWIMWASSAAAVLLLFIFSQTIWDGGQADHMAMHIQTDDVDTMMVYLPDGSLVWLNRESEIRYNEDFDPRHVELTGEAFFEVKRDEEHPFTIAAKGSMTEVLGTSFNIRAYEHEEQVEIFVASGKVSFTNTYHPEKIRILRKHEGAQSVEEKPVEKIGHADQNNIGWMTGSLTFNHSPLDNVFKTLTRQYHINFEISNETILNCKLKADFSDDSLEDILNTIAFGTQVTIERSNGIFLVEGAGCE